MRVGTLLPWGIYPIVSHLAGSAIGAKLGVLVVVRGGGGSTKPRLFSYLTAHFVSFHS